MAGRGDQVGRGAGGSRKGRWAQDPGAFEGRENEEDGKGLPLREDVLRRAIPPNPHPTPQAAASPTHSMETAPWCKFAHFSVWTELVL